jgi:xylulokinase
MGIDAGTSRVRAMVFEPDGTLVAEGSEQPKVSCPKPGWATTVAEDLWQACLKAIRVAASQVDQSEAIRSIAVASVGEAAVPIDARGAPVYPMIAWYDCRSEPQTRWLEQHVGEARLFDITGLKINPMFGLCKQLWLRDNVPEVFNKTVRWLNTADYLAWKLCGVPATDYSLASRTFALNIRSREYAEDLLQEAGIPRAWYQPLVPSGTLLGNLLPQTAELTGLSCDCGVASGGHDHFVGALVTGGMNQGTLINSMGTAEAVILFMDQPIDNRRIGAQGYAQGVIVADRPYYYLVGGLFTSGGAVQWFHRLTAHRYSHQALIEAAWKIPPGANGVLFLPHMRSGSPPNPAELSRGAFLGLGTDTDHIVLYRSILEGMACDVRMIIEGMSRFTEVPEIQAIHCFGGESRNPLLMQIKASVMKRSLTRLDMTEAVCLGAALLGGIGAGIYRNLGEALAGLKFGSEGVPSHLDWVETYQRHYAEVYLGAWRQVRPLQERLLETYGTEKNV